MTSSTARLFDVESFQTNGPPEMPACLIVETAGDIPFLVYVGGGDLGMIFGWYYGYPTCCVKQFCLVTRCIAELDGVEPHRAEELHEIHALSGHILCDRCAAGTPAPLPHRPADRYGLIVPACDEWEDPVVQGPQTRWGADA